MSTAQERRRFHRFPFEADGVLVVPGKGRVPCELVDLSISGALLMLKPPLDELAGQQAQLELMVRGLDHGGEAEIRGKVEAVWQEGEQLGCRYLGVDADSFAQLKALIERNLGDPRLLDRELTQLSYWPGVESSSTV